MGKLTDFSNLRLIPKHVLAKCFGITDEGLKAIRENDPTFPKPIKIGESRQAPVYFDGPEVEAWIQQKKQERDKSTDD